MPECEQHDIERQVDSIDLPPAWEYDPDWVWAGTDAAVYHDTYWGVINGESEVGYIIEVQDNRVVLFEVDEAERNTVVQKEPRDEVRDAIPKFIQLAEEELSEHYQTQDSPDDE